MAGKNIKDFFEELGIEIEEGGQVSESDLYEMIGADTKLEKASTFIRLYLGNRLPYRIYRIRNEGKEGYILKAPEGIRRIIPGEEKEVFEKYF